MSSASPIVYCIRHLDGTMELSFTIPDDYEGIDWIHRYNFSESIPLEPPLPQYLYRLTFNDGKVILTENCPRKADNIKDVQKYALVGQDDNRHVHQDMIVSAIQYLKHKGKLYYRDDHEIADEVWGFL